jgi:two-component system cell cycle response regulator
MSHAEHNDAERAIDPSTMPKVLIVDDSATIRRILGRALEGDGYRIEEAGDGREALERCRAEPPDVVLLDIDMPVMDGLTTLRAMKDDEELRALPVLFLTAHTAGEDVAAGLALGAQDYLRKPCDPAELRARVSTALRTKALEDRLEREVRASLEISTTDPLTGLGNRRRLEARTEELAQRRGTRVPVGVLMIDADHFKRVNDREGHAVGDVVLRIIAGRLGGAVGGDDTVVRWGGEEFIVLTPNATRSHVERLGERLRAAVADAPFAITHTLSLTVTVSVGCAIGAIEDVAALLQAADDALYDAKSNGRNRVAVRSHWTSEASA